MKLTHLLPLLICLFASACGSSNPAKPSQRIDDPVTIDDLFSISDSGRADSLSLLGTWESKGEAVSKSDSAAHSYRQRLRFQDSKLTISKICSYSDGSALRVGVHGAVEVKNASLIILQQPFHTYIRQNLTLVCSIDFPAGLEFRDRAGTVFIRLLDAEKETQMRKIADL